MLSDIDQQYLNYIFSMVLLAFASHPTGDLFSALEFPFLYFYRFHTSCCASGFLGFFLMLNSVKLKNNMAPAQHTAWIFFAKPSTGWTWRSLAGLFREDEHIEKRRRIKSTSCKYRRKKQELCVDGTDKMKTVGVLGAMDRFTTSSGEGQAQRKQNLFLRMMEG
uniref:Uncharacterized protein n=1 Tax=Vombatus ursinus TaxID=29139 RepID=A0A4X2KTQ4_VOMUR